MKNVDKCNTFSAATLFCKLIISCKEISTKPSGVTIPRHISRVCLGHFKIISRKVSDNISLASSGFALATLIKKWEFAPRAKFQDVCGLEADYEVLQT